MEKYIIYDSVCDNFEFDNSYKGADEWSDDCVNFIETYSEELNVDVNRGVGIYKLIKETSYDLMETGHIKMSEKLYDVDLKSVSTADLQKELDKRLDNKGDK